MIQSARQETTYPMRQTEGSTTCVLTINQKRGHVKTVSCGMTTLIIVITTKGLKTPQVLKYKKGIHYANSVLFIEVSVEIVKTVSCGMTSLIIVIMTKCLKTPQVFK